MQHCRNQREGIHTTCSNCGAAARCGEAGYEYVTPSDHGDRQGGAYATDVEEREDIQVRRGRAVADVQALGSRLCNLLIREDVLSRGNAVNDKYSSMLCNSPDQVVLTTAMKVWHKGLDYHGCMRYEARCEVCLMFAAKPSRRETRLYIT